MKLEGQVPRGKPVRRCSKETCRRQVEVTKCTGPHHNEVRGTARVYASILVMRWKCLSLDLESNLWLKAGEILEHHVSEQNIRDEFCYCFVEINREIEFNREIELNRRIKVNSRDVLFVSKVNVLTF